MGTQVRTQQGAVEGREEGGVVVFRGIPYARPPVGALRFRAPEPPAAWSGVLDSGAFAPSAPQNPVMIPLPGMDVGRTDEDCLYLNVWTPGADGARRPVLVWIHGGGYVIGSGSQPIYDGAPLVRRGDVVVVTINYRMGPLGFLHLSDLCDGFPAEAATAGTRDQVAALRWVREEIEAFGGDPENVTIFGESAGGMSVGTLLGTPSARGLFRRAIAQSGACQACHTRESATEAATTYLQHLGVDPSEAARRLPEIPVAELLAAQQRMFLAPTTTSTLLPFQPLVDGDFLPESPLDAVRAGATRGVSLMAGTTRDEWKLFGALMDPEVPRLDADGLVQKIARFHDAAGDLVETYRRAREGRASTHPPDLFYAIETDRIFRVPAIRLAEAHAADGSEAYMYRVDWESPLFGGILGACHAIELPFVFGTHATPGTEAFLGAGPEADALSAAMMDAWIAFARGGDPSCEAIGAWGRYAPDERGTAVLGRERAFARAPDDAERAAWDGVL